MLFEKGPALLQDLFINAAVSGDKPVLLQKL
jgi:hypothetical protein